MIKLTVLYGIPADADAFEHYYTNTHLPIAEKIKGFEKVEYTKFLPAHDGSRPAHFRMAEFWYASPEALQASMGSPEGQAAAADIPMFATGGAVFLVGVVS